MWGSPNPRTHGNNTQPQSIRFSTECIRRKDKIESSPSVLIAAILSLLLMIAWVRNWCLRVVYLVFTASASINICTMSAPPQSAGVLVMWMRQRPRRSAWAERGLRAMDQDVTTCGCMCTTVREDLAALQRKPKMKLQACCKQNCKNTFHLNEVVLRGPYEALKKIFLRSCTGLMFGVLLHFNLNMLWPVHYSSLTLVRKPECSGWFTDWLTFSYSVIRDLMAVSYTRKIIFSLLDCLLLRLN